MFTKKKSNDTDKTSKSDSSSTKIPAPPLKPFTRKGQHVPAKPPIATSFQPDITRRSSEIANTPIRRNDGHLRGPDDNRRLVVGRDIHLNGEITSCDMLIVEGHVEITLPEANKIEISPTGFFKGTAEVQQADISGHFEGSLTAREQLIVRSGGRISGTIRYGKIIIEAGGEISGDMKTIDNPETDKKS